MKLFRSLKKMWKQTPNFTPPSNEVLMQVHDEITKAVSSGYRNPKILALYQSVPVKYLLDCAVQMYVGSTSCPRNPEAVAQLIDQAKKNAKNNKQLLLNISYYEQYLQKLDALSQGDQEKFDAATQGILDLAVEGHPIANHLVGKQLYNVSKSYVGKKQKKDRLQTIQAAVEKLNAAVQQGSFHSLYTLGCLHEEGETVKGIDYETAYQYFLLAASYNNPYAYFKLALYNKQGRAPVSKPNLSLYLYYLRKAAELGLLEAQHNMGVQYLNGEIVPKNEVKALAWFLHAGEHGFSHSKYNAAKILLTGTECRTLKPNLQAALVKFQEVQKKGDIDCTDIIEKLIQELSKPRAQQQPPEAPKAQNI